LTDMTCSVRHFLVHLNPFKTRLDTKSRIRQER
jgi:hypothetical protein